MLGDTLRRAWEPCVLVAGLLVVGALAHADGVLAAGSKKAWLKTRTRAGGG